jgi:hypothetical protein
VAEPADLLLAERMQPDPFQNGHRRHRQFGVGARHAQQVEAHPAPGLDHQPDIFENGEIGKQVGQLESAPQSLAAAQGHRVARHVLAHQPDRAFGRRDLPRNEIEISGLAGAVGSDDGGQFTGPEAAADSVDRHMAAKADGQAIRFQKHLCHGAPMEEKKGCRGRHKAGVRGSEA